MSNSQASAQETPSLKAGHVIDGRFQIVRKIGEGGMGSVFLAWQLNLERNVVVKVLKPELCNNDEQVERFRREAMLVCKLTHPNSILTHDFGIDDGVPFIVMEHLEGDSLADLIYKKKSLSIQETAHVLVQVCHSLKEAHDMGMIHRDLKPENIHVLNEPARPNLVKVLDFGIAKLITSHPDASKSNLTKGDIIFGTPQYMAPEQIRGKDLDARADIYSLGVILYQCVTGHIPYDSSVVVDILTQHLTQPIPSPTLAELPKLSEETLAGFNRLLKMTMAKRAEERLSNVSDFIIELERLAQLEQTSHISVTPAPAPAPASPPKPKAKRGGSRFFLALILLISGGAYVYFKMPHLSPDQRGWGSYAQVKYSQYRQFVGSLLYEDGAVAPQHSEAPEATTPSADEGGAEPQSATGDLGDQTATLNTSSDVFKVDELLDDSDLAEDVRHMEVGSLGAAGAQLKAKTPTEGGQEPPSTEEPAEEPTEELNTAEPWTLQLDSKHPEEVSVLLYKGTEKRPFKSLKLSLGAPQTLKLDPQHRYKVICKAQGQKLMGKRLKGRSGELRALTCFSP